MISHKHRCIFIHIPKCAGTSFESALGHMDNYSGRGGQDHRSIRMIERPFLTPKAFSSKENLIELIKTQKHRYLDDVGNPENKSRITKQQYREYFKFTVVRNPWARAFSWYKNVLIDKAHQRSNGTTSTISFKEFLTEFAGRDMLKPQTYWLKNYAGELPFDYIARFENLSEDTQEIAFRLNIKNLSLPHKAKGRAGDYREHYDAEMHDLVNTLYAEEIELFKYSFDPTPELDSRIIKKPVKQKVY